MSDSLVQVRSLVKHFKLEPKGLFDASPVLRAVDGIDFDVQRGETLGLGRTLLAKQGDLPTLYGIRALRSGTE